MNANRKNRLADETSPYLLQHAGNPVDWYPWGEEALARAHEEDKPILLSIGYAACHWCHVMERESFENAETAELMNKLFVNIKVDREERPDLDAIYMGAVTALTGSGGWPMTVFLTPDGKPFAGGTYFPPEQRHGMPAFRQVLRSIDAAWRDKREQVVESGQQVVEHIRKSATLKPAEGKLAAEEIFPNAYENLVMSFDPEWGGWGNPPKFPSPSTLEFLLRRGDDSPMTETTLDRMVTGGMYDLLGGGFHRYSVDRTWLTPHFEKMLYDNALLAVVYLHGFAVLGKARYRQVVEETIGYMLRELALDGGGFASAQDADTDGVEGLTFTWKRGDDVPDPVLHHFEKDRFILRGELDEELRARLFAEREQRPKPSLDDKAIASWNGLALAALAECGRALDRRDWVDAARRLAEFLLGPLSSVDGRLHRTWRSGVAKGTGYLEDYADVANGLYELHLATGELRWLEESNRLARLAIEFFADEENGGFFQTPADGEQLVARTKELDDTPTPSGSSMLAYVLVRLARIWGDEELEARADAALRIVAAPMSRAPTGFGWSLVALDLHLADSRELAIVGPYDSAVAQAALRQWEPRTVIAFGPSEHVPLLAGKELVDGKPAVYVCERFACRAPVTDPAGLETAPSTT
ncbi:MAG TPA: thioredoxin domain-containing protein [Gaiellaceae bacterium]